MVANVLAKEKICKTKNEEKDRSLCIKGNRCGVHVSFMVSFPKRVWQK